MAPFVDEGTRTVYQEARDKVAGDPEALKRFEGLYAEARYLAEHTTRACRNTAHHVDGDHDKNTRDIARWVITILNNRFPEEAPHVQA